jgi:hypothetical protein
MPVPEAFHRLWTRLDTIVADVRPTPRGAVVGEVMLLADPGAPRVIAMYERMGFREAGRLVSIRGPTPAA